MQGEAVESSVIAALDRIYPRVEEFDCVVIIRGGGATSDLSGFDTLVLAENVANFPLPVITGIGHDRDESILDMVANTRVKTPTAAAQLLIDNLSRTSVLIDNLRQRILQCTQQRMQHEQLRFKAVAERIPVLFSLVNVKQQARIDQLSRQIMSGVTRHIDAERQKLDGLTVRIGNAVARCMTAEQHRLALLAQRIEAENPERLLRRGYSITTYEGRAVRDASLLPKGAEVETRVERGSFKSRVE